VQEQPPVVEEEIAEPPPRPPPRGRPPTIWPWLLLLLLLVAGGLIALWLFARDNGHKNAGSVTVPNVIGQKQGPAVQRLDDAGLTSRVVARPSSHPAGTVFEERPAPGTHVSRRSVVLLMSSSAAEITVPSVVGDRVGPAVRALRAQGLTVQTASVTSTRAPGHVLAQSPGAGASVAKGSTVTIRVSSAPSRVPNVVGQKRTAAVSVLKAAGLNPKVFVVPGIQPKNSVVAQRPPAGASVPRGTDVRVNVSSGKAPAGGAPPPPPPPPASRSVPDVTDKAQQGAQRQLNALGFKSLVRYVPSDQPQGTIVSQSPADGRSGKVGTRVTLNASLGPNPGAGQAVPKVIGLDPPRARSRLENAGFSVQQLTQKTSVRSLSGKIVDVQPGRGVHAPAGSVVTIYVGRLS
jgi:beta-lactam-binding protein with PASTA domain